MLDQGLNALQQAAGHHPAGQAEPGAQVVKRTSELSEPVNDKGRLVQRGVVKPEYLRPTVVDIVILKPAHTPGRDFSYTVVMEEPRVGQQPDQPEGNEPGVLTTTALMARLTVLRDGAGQEVERPAHRLASGASGAQDRQNLARIDDR
ncbi:hypothetical protein HOK021_65450 [Streptomyces hygroscopicus]|nr:hypothetical protein HOK021_65450 [Streptomyces hygroscopicus]